MTTGKTVPNDIRSEGSEWEPFQACPLCACAEFALLFEFGRIHIFLCSRCRMMFLNPHLKPQAMVRIFSSAEELLKVTPVFQHYFEEKSWNTPKTAAIYRNCLSRLRQLAPEAKKILDVGCGKGTFLKLAKEEGWEACGIETNRDAVRALVEDSKISVIEKDFLGLDSSEGRWDVITLWDLIEHVPNPMDWIKQCYDLLKPSGLVLMATPNHRSLLDSLGLAAYRLSAGQFHLALEKLYTIDHTLYFTDRTLQYALEKAGFQILSSVKVNTDLERYTLKPWFRMVSEILLALSHALNLQNRVIMMGLKR